MSPGRTLLLVLLLAAAPFRPPAPAGSGAFERALDEARRALTANDLPGAQAALERALERDPNALAAWELQERWAEAKGDKDERVYALHRQLALARAQKKDKATLAALNARLLPLDPVAQPLVALRTKYVDKLVKLAEGYEKAKRPHSAIRTYKQALALDPERDDLRATIERLANAPDPSLAEDARPRDLLEGISEEWIAEHDAEHEEWKDRARLERENYVTQTDAGYEVLVRTAEAMEQMNGFYRRFFRYGSEGDKRSVSRIEVNIFKTRDEYTKDPKDWSGGHFTGSAVETYIPDGGFEAMLSVLFHEAAHQFVSLATNASGWLNEGLASFFEGSRILSNGTVLMNLPATHRLFPLVERMQKGWMADVTDGIDPADVTKDPPKAPTFRIVLEDRYEWGPPWYAPTWGVVYFLYNFQDPADGRFVYRKAFAEFIDASGGKMGEGAIETFEEVVLGHPEPVTEGERSTLKLPTTVDEVDEVWKSYLYALVDQQTGRAKAAPPYREWARHARTRGALDDAAEFYELALATTPRDVALLIDFAGFLGERKSDDRATKLLNQAAVELERAPPVDEKRLGEVEALLRKYDAQYERLEDVRGELVKDARALVDQYLAADLDLMAMEVSFRLGQELAEPSLFAGYEAALRKEGRSPERWRLAYDEESLDGWRAAGLEDKFVPQGELLLAKNGVYAKGAGDYTFLTLDEVTSGDFSMEAEVQATSGQVVFAGLVFGRKSATDFHALVLYPPAPDKNGFVNLVTFYGSGASDTWRRNPVQHRDAGKKEAPKDAEATTTPAGESTFYKLRIDVTGRLVDVWVDGQFMATQEFPSLDVVRGSFGLLCGRGQAAFRNVRYLARSARDPSAEIERKLRQGSASAEESRNGSWLGLVPPFPDTQRWLQGARSDWGEKRGFPQMLVFWSLAQNDQVEIDGWLRSQAEKHADVGLEVVSVLSGWDGDGAEDYLKQHVFPGAVALDAIKDNQGIGVTFERFEVGRFHLPRVILLDIDGKVAWEGDPGFTKGERWKGQESLVDVPLRELVSKRRLPELLTWKRAWPTARADVARGAFAAAAPTLKAASDFDATVTPEVAEAQAIVATLEGALEDADALAQELAAAKREPALEVLHAWAEALGHPVPSTKVQKAALKADTLTSWKRSQALLKPVLVKLQAGKDPGALDDVLAKVAALPGAFPAELVERVRAAGTDPAALRQALEEGQELPALWLTREHFHW